MTVPNTGSDTSAKPGMKCPGCKLDLVMTERQNIEIDYCPECRGIWLDRGELDKIIERSLQPQTPAPQNPAPQNPAPQDDNRGYRQDSGHRGGGHGGSKHGGGHSGGRRGSWLQDIFH